METTSKKTKSSEDDPLEATSSSESYVSYEVVETQRLHRIYLDENVSSPKDYIQLAQLFRTVKSDEVVQLFVGNYGGDLDGAVRVVNAMNACKAPVHVVVDTPSYSAASIIALSGDSLELLKDSVLMFHNYTSWAIGKGKELVDRTLRDYKAYEKFLYNRCSPFLTDKEIRLIMNDGDIYIEYDHPSVPRRTKRHFKVRSPRRVGS